MTAFRIPFPSFRRQALAAAALLALTPALHAQTYTWSNGTFTPGVTAPATLGGLEILEINTGGFKYFDTTSGTFTNGGTVNWNADPLYLQGNARIVNNALWDARGDLLLAYNGGAPAFTNNGTFRKSAGTGNLTIQGGTGFVNNGVLDAQVGAINFVGGSTFNAGSVFTGAGRNLVWSGSNSFNGAFTSGNLVLAGGNHVGNNAVIGGSVLFTGGSFNGSWAVGSGQQLVVATGGFKYFDGAGSSFVNNGSVLWNADPLYLQNGANVVNNANWEATDNGVLAYNGGSVSFTNNGSFIKSGATGNTTVQNGTGFVNNGTIDARSGSIVFNGGSSFNAGSVFTGAGRVVATGGANTFNGSFTASNLVLEGGTHQGGSAVINGVVRFEGGAIDGTWSVGAGQTLRGEDGGFKYLYGTLVNNGTFSWNTGGALYMQNGGTLVNNGLFVNTVTTQILNNGGAQPVFDNRAGGTLRAAAGTTLSVGNMLVNNGGTLEAEAGASIRYTGGAVFNAGSIFSGPGSNLAVGNNSFNGAQIVSALELQSGAHQGAAAVVNGGLSFTGGTLQGSWAVAAGSTLTAGDGGFKYLSGTDTVLTNQGTISWATGNALYLQSGATLANTGLFVATTSTQILNNGGALPSFNNTGTLRATNGATLSIGNTLVNNGGTLDAQAASSIRYTGGASFNAGTTFSGAGSNVVVSGGNSFNGAFASANLVLEGGNHVGDGAVAGGTTRFSGGSFNGSWQVPSGATLTGTDGGFKYIAGTPTTLENRGTINWATGNALYLENGATLRNTGTLDLQADTAILYNGGAGPSFINTGLVVKSAGAGTATIGNSSGFDNQGTVDVRSGTLALPNNFVNNGVLMGTGAYSVSGTLANAGTVAPGASTGTLALAGNYAQAAGGVFAVELTSLTEHDLFNVSGTAALDGTLALSCFGDCSLAVGSVLTILDAGGDLSGSFAAVTLSGFQTGAFSVVYDTVADRVQLLVTETVTAAVPEPGTYALWLAGLAAMGFMVRRRR